MNEQDLRKIVRRVARRHLETAHPERLEELEVVFDGAFARAAENAPDATAVDGHSGLAFEASLLELSVVGFTVASALQLVQIALLSQRVERLREIVEGARGFSKAQRSELFEIAEHAAREVATWRPGEPAEPLPLEALQLLVLRRERHGRPLLEFVLHGRPRGDEAGRSYDRRSFGVVALDEAPAEFVEQLFAHMVKGDLESDRERVSAAEWLRRRGAHLYETLLPKSLQAELRELARSGGPLLVISEEPWIPWEVLRVPPAAGAGQGRFLAEAFALARWLPGAAVPAAELPLRRIALVRSGKADEERRGGGEASDVANLAEAAGRGAEAVAADSLAFTEGMARGAHDAWHFIGHGDHSRRGAEWDELALDDGVLNPPDLPDEVGRGLAGVRPFVFLNACHVGGVRQGLTGAGGWPARFLEVGAGAFLGALWAVPGDKAAVFASAVYERLLAGEPIGEAVRRARLVLRDRFPGDTTWLAYALYADPAALSPPTER